MLRSGFLRPITDCRSQNAVSADPITDTDLFKAIVLSCRIIYNDTPISIFRHLFSAWISFLKMGGIPLLGDSCDNLRGGGGHFLDIFQKYTFISPKCLIIQCIFVFKIVQLLQKSLHSTSLISHRSPLLIHLFTTNTTFIHYFDFKSKHCYWKCFFIVILFSFTVIQSL